MKHNDHLYKLRHSAEHVLHQAVKELYPNIHLAMGPATDDGFYFDFDSSPEGKETITITDADFKKIEKRMWSIINKNLPITRHEISASEARKLFADNPYKQEWIEKAAQNNEPITIYWTGEPDAEGSMVDLCAGPHVGTTGEIKAFKLLSMAGAYWHGDEKNKMLTRIYGTAFGSKEELNDHLTLLEEAKKRDHRKLGKDLDLFTFSDLVGKGLPMFTPRGTMLRELLNDYSQGLRAKKGYHKVWTPHITKKELYETSGHWAKFGDELFLVTSQETSDEMVLKPMNCPHHTQIYASKPRSYRELPLRYMETTTTYRDEQAGELLGLSRVRSITMDDTHIFCTKDQIKGIYEELLDVVQTFYKSINMKLELRLSFWDPENQDKYLGDPTLWEHAQSTLEEIAKEKKLEYVAEAGEAAFYGPKFDFMGVDALGRKWQVATIQLDFAMPDRFKLSYVDESGAEQMPVMIHHALMGSIERFLSVYIEHTGGSFPLWLAPEQVRIIPISERHIDTARSIVDKLQEINVRYELDDKALSMQKKIRNAQQSKVNYMLILGDKEVESGEVNVRSRDGSTENMSVTSFVNKVQEEVADRK